MKVHSFIKKNKMKIIKLIIVLFIYVLWVITRLFILNKDDTGFINKLYCFQDNFMIKGLTGFTNYLSQFLQLRDYILIFASNSLDVLVVFTGMYYAIYGNSSKFVFVFGIFFLTRSLIIQKISLFQIYDTYLFSRTGFISLVVPLYRAADFFYSGHVGTSVICTFYIKESVKPKWLFYAGFFIVLVETFVMISLRAHYTIDIIFGFIAAHWTFIIVPVLSNWFDKKFGFLGRPNNKVDDNYKENTNPEQIKIDSKKESLIV